MGSAGKRPDRSADISGNSSQVAIRIPCDSPSDRRIVSRQRSDQIEAPGAPEQQAREPLTLQRRLSDGYGDSLSRWFQGTRGARRAEADAIRSASTVRAADGTPFSRAPSGRPALLGRMRPRRGYRHLAPAPQGRWAYLCSIGGPCFEDGLAGVSLGLGLLVPGPRAGHAGEHVS